MSRLNLDIFSAEQSDASENKSTDSLCEGRKTSRDSGGTNTRTTLVPPSQEDAPAVESPRFVPVGFHAEHLRLLDEAVLKLRRAGHWKASKSGIIRILIEMHRHELDRVWLEKRR